jgi:hypothetical protein
MLALLDPPREASRMDARDRCARAMGVPTLTAVAAAGAAAAVAADDRAAAGDGPPVPAPELLGRRERGAPPRGNAALSSSECSEHLSCAAPMLVVEEAGRWSAARVLSVAELSSPALPGVVSMCRRMPLLGDLGLLSEAPKPMVDAAPPVLTGSTASRGGRATASTSSCVHSQRRRRSCASGGATW